MREFRHDLLSLLNQVLGYSYLVEEEASDGGYESVVKDIQKIQKVGKSMERLIADQLVNAWPQDLLNVSEEGSAPKKSKTLRPLLMRKAPMWWLTSMDEYWLWMMRKRTDQCCVAS